MSIKMISKNHPKSSYILYKSYYHFSSLKIENKEMYTNDTLIF